MRSRGGSLGKFRISRRECFVAGVVAIAVACGNGEEARPIDELSAEAIERRLDQDYGGFLFDGYPFDIPRAEQPDAAFWQFVAGIDDPEGPCDAEIALEPGLDGLPEWFPATAQRSCGDGRVHGHWKPLGDQSVGAFFGSMLDGGPVGGGRIVGIYGRGRVYGALVGPDQFPRFLLVGRYADRHFRVAVLDHDLRRAGTLRGRVKGGRFGGKWSRRCSEACPPCPPGTAPDRRGCGCMPLPEPPPECIEEELRLGCRPLPELHRIAEDLCASRGMMLATADPIAPCYEPPYPLPPAPYPDAGVGDCDYEGAPPCDAGVPYPPAPRQMPLISGLRVTCCGVRPPPPPPPPGACTSTVVDGGCMSWHQWEQRAFDHCAMQGMTLAGLEPADFCDARFPPPPMAYPDAGPLDDWATDAGVPTPPPAMPDGGDVAYPVDGGIPWTPPAPLPPREDMVRAMYLTCCLDVLPPPPPCYPGGPCSYDDAGTY